jgi:hypothetical protein
MGDFPTEWEWPASATSRPNGLVSARCLDWPCWASSLSKRDSRTSLYAQRPSFRPRQAQNRVADEAIVPNFSNSKRPGEGGDVVDNRFNWAF